MIRVKKMFIFGFKVFFVKHFLRQLYPHDVRWVNCYDAIINNNNSSNNNDNNENKVDNNNNNHDDNNDNDSNNNNENKVDNNSNNSLGNNDGDSNNNNMNNNLLLKDLILKLSKLTFSRLKYIILVLDISAMSYSNYPIIMDSAA